MRIAIDARLNAYRIGGIPQYTRRLAAALAALSPNDRVITLQHRTHCAPLVDAPNAERHTLLTPPHHRLEQFALPLELLRVRADLLHFPDFVVPRLRLVPAVTTIHDLAFLHYPEILDADARAYYGQVRASAQRADAVIAVSEATRRDIADRLDLEPERVDVVYEAAAPFFRPIEILPDARRMIAGRDMAAGAFLLFVSTIEPRKNLPTLLRALRICLDRWPERPYRLAIVGARGWRDQATFDALRDLRLGDSVDMLGKVADEELRWLYAACRLYANPSLYEGFGLPLLEAMACGAACLVSDNSSLPEIGGTAAVYIAPQDAEQWAEMIVTLWGDDDRRAELGRLGIVRAGQFSWERAARETLAIYRRVLSR